MQTRKCVKSQGRVSGTHEFRAIRIESTCFFQFTYDYFVDNEKLVKLEST